MALLLLASPASAQVFPIPGPGRAVFGGGPVGGSCATPTDFTVDADIEHVYFHEASTMTGGAPDDEAGTADLAASIGLDATNLSSSGLPVGTPAGKYRIALGAGEQALITTAPTGYLVPAANSDFTLVAWLKLPTLPASYYDMFEVLGNAGDGTTPESGWWGVHAAGDIYYSPPGDQGQHASATGLATADTWMHLSAWSDNEGTAANDTVGVSFNGTTSQTTTLPDFSGLPSSATFGFLNDDGDGAGQGEAEIFEAAIFHRTLSSTELMEICCCGLDGTADPDEREALCGGTGGTSCAGF